MSMLYLSRILIKKVFLIVFLLGKYYYIKIVIIIDGLTPITHGLIKVSTFYDSSRSARHLTIFLHIRQGGKPAEKIKKPTNFSIEA